MKLTTCLLILVLLFVPFQAVSAGQGTERSVVTITAKQVDSADDIEAAIKQATAEGTRPGTVILDGKEGPFVLTGDDRSLNIFVSNLILRGVNQPVIKGCDDGLFFDDLHFPLKHILIEGIAFLCSGDGMEASRTFQDVTLRNNLFQGGNNGIGAGGHSSGWLISGNVIQGGMDAINIRGAERVVISNNHLSGNIGVALLECSTFQVRRNAIQARYQGVLLGQEAWANLVQGNTIMGVSAAGIALEPGVTHNRVLANSVLCAPGNSCLTVDATAAVMKANTIAGNRP